MAEKETFYFSHDYNARNDPRLIRLAAKHGMAGLGIYWCIIEMLYEQAGYLPLIDIESIAYDLHSECERIANVLQNFDLFKFSEDKFYSESVLKRLEKRKDKSDKARQSANNRWGDANAMRTHSERYANKGKKRKVNNKEVFDFKQSLIDLGVTEKIASDWIEVRKKTKAINTETSFNNIKNQIILSGLTPDNCIKKAVEKNWRGFEADWIKKDTNLTPKQPVKQFKDEY